MTLHQETDIQRSLIRDLDDGFATLVHVYQPGVYSGAIRLTHNREDAQDIAQDTFVRAYRALERYDESKISTLQLRPWLWTIALNLCRNKASRTKRTSPLPDDPVAGLPEPEPFDIDMWTNRLAQLTQNQRTIVVLRYVVGLPVKEVSDITGRPQGTIKADASRALGKLRTIVTSEESKPEIRGIHD